jgi:tetratricopeptide (TPR) repeat protein
VRAGQNRPKEGQDRPRWRAKQRHRLDHAPSSRPDPREELDAWIQGQELPEREIDALESLDLTWYLRDTAHVDLPPTERLRKLAIALEARLSISDQPRGFLVLERIYAVGRALDPGDAEIEISRAITAQECAFFLDDRPEARRRIVRAGREAAGRALEIRPNDAFAHHTLGMLDYSSRHGSIPSALSCFERAVALDPGLGWARLYRAHCLHDQARWPEAAAAYAEVDPSFLVGPRAWRYDLLREQRAFCLLQAGDRESALADFLTILHRYEQQPELARFQELRELTAAADGSLREELADRLARLKLVIHPPSSTEEQESE